MPQNPSTVNLIPQTEVKEQARVKLVKSSTLITLALLVITVLISGLLFYRKKILSDEIDGVMVEISDFRVRVADMSDIEISARNLDKRSTTLKEILTTRQYYSSLMNEIRIRAPSNVSIDTMALGKESSINISGTGADYISIARFINNLSDTKFEGSTEGFESMFTDVSLNSVNLDVQTDEARFFIVVTYDMEMLTL